MYLQLIKCMFCKESLNRKYGILLQLLCLYHNDTKQQSATRPVVVCSFYTAIRESVKTISDSSEGHSGAANNTQQHTECTAHHLMNDRCHAHTLGKK